MNLSKLLKAAIIVPVISAAVATASDAEEHAIMMHFDRASVTVGDTELPAQGTPFVYEGNLYVPADDILKNTGFVLGWDNEQRSIIAYRDGVYSYIPAADNVLTVADEEFTFDVPTIYFNDIFYMPIVMYAQMSDSAIYFDGQPQYIQTKKRDLLEDTEVTDEYRLPYSDVNTYRGVTIIGTRGMEILSVTGTAAKNYAAVINTVAGSLPEEVDIYSIAVPTACEFYAPRRIYTNQTNGIKELYSLLCDRVTPVNIVKPLMEHAAEKTYFSTDHHWTQRGAYYAYKAFASAAGLALPPLESFEKNDFWSYVGSLASFTSGTDGASVMRSNPELLERFIPRVGVTGEAFVNMDMTYKFYEPAAVNCNINTYSAFMGGDCPIAKFTTDNKNGKKVCIIKDSFGTAFSSWALNNYEEVYMIDPREFNGFGGHSEHFSLVTFYEKVHFDDLIIINYPGSIAGSDYRSSLLKMTE